MKRYHILITLLLSLLMVTSCQWGLEDLEANDECEIIDFNFEKRTLIEEQRVVRDADGKEILYYVDRVVFEPDRKASIVINNAERIVNVTVKEGTDIKNVVGYAVLSPGAVIVPIEGAPALGTLADFSSSKKYKVTAADGINSKVWQVNVTP